MSANVSLVSRVKLRIGRVWRNWCDRRARTSVLVLGDSHVRVFEHWLFMWYLPHVRWRIVYVPGGSASGLYNRDSLTQAYKNFEQALTTVKADFVILNLGEVDAGHAIWARAQRSGRPMAALLDDAVANYTRYIHELAPQCRLIVVSAPLPTLGDDFQPHDETARTRRAVTLSQRERTALTLAFNDRVGQACRAIGVPHLDDRAWSMGPDGLVRRRWMNRDFADHHYHRKVYARWLSRSLRPILAVDGPQRIQSWTHRA